MKRSVKNVILIILIVLVGVAIGFTMHYAGESLSTTSNTQEMGFPGGNEGPKGNSDMGEPPEKREESEDKEDTDTEEDTTKEEDSKDSEDSDRPEMPDGEKPDGDMPSGEKPSDMGEPNGGNMEMPSNSSSEDTSDSLETKYIVLFIVEGLVLSILITEAIFTKFNKKTLKETFEDKDKLIIAILVSLILAGVLFISEYAVSTKLLPTTSTQEVSNMEMPERNEEMENKEDTDTEEDTEEDTDTKTESA